MISRPMLAAKFDSDPAVAYEQMKSLRFPVLASTKIDGIRAHQYRGVLYSRKNKPIPNVHTQKLFSDFTLDGADGELVVGRPNVNTCFNTTQSGTMSQDGEPDVKYYIFDYTASKNSFSVRQILLSSMTEISNVILVEQKLINSLDDLLNFEYESVTTGWEGIMIRDPNGPYKQGRSTLREGWLIKMKQFQDSEAVIVSAYEQETNLNEAIINEIGRSKRSSHQENKVANGHLGGFRVKDVKSGVEFNIGNFDGVTKELRHQWWQNYLARPDYFINRVITYKFFPVGVKDKPRHPTFKGFRSKIDW